MSFWNGPGGNIVVGVTGNPIDCSVCPCGIETSCCKSRQIPTTLYGHVTILTGTCPCLELTFALVWNSVLQLWESEPQCTMTNGVRIQCTESGWVLTYDASEIIVGPLPGSSCDPFSQSFNVSWDSGSTCSGLATGTVTITEVP